MQHLKLIFKLFANPLLVKPNLIFDKSWQIEASVLERKINVIIFDKDDTLVPNH